METALEKWGTPLGKTSGEGRVRFMGRKLGRCANRVQSKVKTLILHSIFRIFFRDFPKVAIAGWLPNLCTSGKLEFS